MMTLELMNYSKSKLSSLQTIMLQDKKKILHWYFCHLKLKVYYVTVWLLLKRNNPLKSYLPTHLIHYKHLINVSLGYYYPLPYFPTYHHSLPIFIISSISLTSFLSSPSLLLSASIISLLHYAGAYSLLILSYSEPVFLLPPN